MGATDGRHMASRYVLTLAAPDIRAIRIALPHGLGLFVSFPLVVPSFCGMNCRSSFR